MRIQSLGIESDLIFHRANGEVIDRGDYVLVRTPSQPSYFWGNYLIYAQAPIAQRMAEWEAAFEREFAAQPLSTHKSFTWDVRALAEPLAEEHVQALAVCGYEYDVSVVLAASSIRLPAHPNLEVAYRSLSSDTDWQQMIELQLEGRDEEFAEAPYREFLRSRVDSWRRLVAAGSGIWLGAFEGELLVADAGLFWTRKLGRFQNVETRVSHRRRGICGSLVHRLSEYGFREVGLRQLVMQADEDYHAARIYESLGFERVERVAGLCRYDRAVWGSSV